MNNMTQEKCYSCGGKGTYSQMHGIHGAEDFGADGFDLPPGIHNYPCKACDGTGLKKVMTQDWKELRDDWMMYHAELYQPGSPINTMTIFDWWMNKLKEQRLAVLSEAIINVDKMAMYQLQEGGSQYVSKEMLIILLESLKSK